MNWWHRFVRDQNKSEPADEATCAAARLPVVLEAFWRVVGTIDWAPRAEERLPD